MYASTLPELAGQNFNCIAEATLAIDREFYVEIPDNWLADGLWYCDLPPKKQAHVCLEWIVAV